MTLVDTDVLIAHLRGIEPAGTWLRQAPMQGAARGERGVHRLIAATAQHRGAALTTLNVRHFPLFPKLEPPWS